MKPLAVFGNLGGIDGIFILLVLLLLFGAKRIPELARGLAAALREFFTAKSEIEQEISFRLPERSRETGDVDNFTFALALSFILTLILLFESAVHQR